MPPPPEVQQLRAALGDAFPAFTEAKNRYRDGLGDAMGFLSAFYSLTAADDGLAARADALLGLATALLPPAHRGALRDPTLRGRARAAALAQQEALRATFSVTLKSLQRPAVVLELGRDLRVEELRAQCSAGTGGSVRLLVSGAALEDGQTLGDYPALAVPGATIHLLAVRAPPPAPEPEPAPTEVASPAPAPPAPQAVVAAQADRQRRLQQQAEQEEADHLLALALAEADAEELRAAELAAELAAAEAEAAQESEEEDGRFSDDDETVVGEVDFAAGSAAGGGSPLPVREDIADLTTEISTAQAQTAWSGCPEAYALAVSGVGDSELAQRVRAAVSTIAAARANDFGRDFGRTLTARREGGWLHRHPPTSPAGTKWEPCLGCGDDSAIKIVKRCGCCTVRDECRCPPQWCEECLLKWWLSSNQRRVEKSTPAPGVGMVAMGIDPRWVARCPTCTYSGDIHDMNRHPKTGVSMKDHLDNLYLPRGRSVFVLPQRRHTCSIDCRREQLGVVESSRPCEPSGPGAVHCWAWADRRGGE